MNAGQRELQWMKAALPQKIEQSCEENWRSYLENGIAADRVSTISYGKERPAVLGSTEAAWAQNRRAVTVVKTAN